jgi:calcineurin-like phosphoesterase family protein
MIIDIRWKEKIFLSHYFINMRKKMKTRILKIKSEVPIVVAGDVHGCLAQLKKLYIRVKNNKKQLFLVGDLIDRGPDSIGVIDFVRKNNIKTVLGNHEKMFLEYKERVDIIIKDHHKRIRVVEDKLEEHLIKDSLKLSLMSLLEDSNWFYNGGREVFLEYMKKNDDFKTYQDDLNFISSLPYFIVVKVKGVKTKVLISHTLAYNEYKALKLLEGDESFKSKSLEEGILWQRNHHKRIKQNKTKFFNIFGHTPVDVYDSKVYSRIQGDIVPMPVVSTEQVHRIANVDTGCAYKGKRARGFLSAISFPCLETYQEENK